MTYQAQFRDAVPIGGARIYSLYAVTTLVCLVQLLCGLDVWGNSVATVWPTAANLLLVQAWSVTGHTLNAPAWSIGAEWAANLLFPTLVVVLIRWRSRTAVHAGVAAFLCLTAYAVLFGRLRENAPGAVP